jgi:hypothetical protein
MKPTLSVSAASAVVQNAGSAPPSEAPPAKAVARFANWRRVMPRTVSENNELGEPLSGEW